MYCFGFCFSSLSIKGGEEKLKKVFFWFGILVFFIILLSKNVSLTFIFNFMWVTIAVVTCFLYL